MTGFTGVDWDARNSEQLVSDLGDGPGPGPLAEAGLAWARLSADLGEAGAEYAAVLARLGVHWQSAQSSAAFERLTRLAPWFADTAVEAGYNAARAHAQAAAITVARLNMPAIAEIGLVQQMHEISRAANSVVPLIAGAAAQIERAAHDQHMRASRVMQAYEVATEPVAKPWNSASPAPDLVSAAPLDAEHAAQRVTTNAAVQTPPSPVASPGAPSVLPAGFVALQQEKLAYIPTTLAQPQSPAPGVARDLSAPQVSQPHPTSAAPPMAPSPVTAAAGDRTVVRVVDSGIPGSSESGVVATESENPTTWADIAVADHAVAQHVVKPGSVDPRYTAETLLLGPDGGRRP